jgi:FtsP/CotA-like multicopper oxidase with cupredoxin domain
MHWHGMHLVGEAWMDGVANITQCPVPPSTSFTYEFTAFPTGVHWYHSHALNQRTDGLYGLLLVRRLQEAPAVGLILSQLYQ